MNENMIRDLLTRQSESILRISLDLLAIKQCLLTKGLVTEADYNAAVQQVHRESKQTLQGLHDQDDTKKQN